MESVKSELDKPIELLKKLVEIPSPSGEEEEIVGFLYDYIKNLGFKVVKDGLNLVVNPAEFFVVTHVDTVSIKRPFSFDGKFAYGTGVCDAKGSIVSILLVLERIDELNFGIALLSDEEESGEGSKHFASKYKPRMAVVMEPTSLTIANKHYGSLEVEVIVKGKTSHGSMPEYGINAIEKSFELFGVLKLISTKHSILKIEGGSDEYVTPDTCKIKIDFVFPPEVDVERLKRQVFGLISKYGDIKIVEEYGGFKSGEVVKRLEKAIKLAGLDLKYSAMPSWTDAINLRLEGCDAVVWGPGELQYCHTEMEKINPREIMEASGVLVKLNGVLS
ncbi:peptidase M20 [Archaeoglobales archaeon]|nr:MAG: peptidase M20 [Archaeoglobales archaeon]